MTGAPNKIREEERPVTEEQKKWHTIGRLENLRLLMHYFCDGELKQKTKIYLKDLHFELEHKLETKEYVK